MKKYWLLFFIVTNTYANIANDLDNYFNQLGFASNTTSMQAVQSQASGYFGGGSLYARSPVRNEELATIELPNYRAGCAGIDVFTGSISYINGDKLVNLGKQIMTNSGAYAVDVMLATTVPELKQVRDFLQTTVQKVNQSSINSCEMAQNLVGGVWPKTVASQEKICNDQLRMGKSGGAHDYVSARMHCAGDGYHQTLDEATQDKTQQKQVVMNKNLIWSLLQEKSFLRDNQELSELIMSLTGTLIINKEGHVTDVPSLANHPALLLALLGEKKETASLWHCNESTACLEVNLQPITMSEQQGLHGRIRQLILSLDDKLKADTPLTQEEKGFLEMTSLPVMKFLLVENSLSQHSAAADLEAYTALIAQDLLSHYLKELLQEASQVTQTSVMNEALVKLLAHRIERAYHTIASMAPKVSKKLMQKLALIQYVSQMEKQVATNLNEGLS